MRRCSHTPITHVGLCGYLNDEEVYCDVTIVDIRKVTIPTLGLVDYHGIGYWRNEDGEITQIRVVHRPDFKGKVVLGTTEERAHVRKIETEFHPGAYGKITPIGCIFGGEEVEGDYYILRS